MAITVEERYKGRSGNEKARSITYLVRGTDDDTVAINSTATQIVADTPAATWDGLQLDSISATQLADDIWATVASYKPFKKTDPPDPLESDEVAFEFSYSAQSEHVKQSIATVNTYPATGITAYDYKGAINVVDDGGHLRVEGIDIPASPTTHSWTYYPVNATVDAAYQLVVMGLMGKTNSDIFLGAAIGEVRFVGCRGSVRTDEDWQIRFDFSYKKNQTGLTRGGIEDIALGGHDILWMLYGDILDSNGWLVKTPMVAYVEQVLDSGAFSGLDLA